MKKRTLQGIICASAVLCVWGMPGVHGQELVEPEPVKIQQPPWLGVMMEMNGAAAGQDAVDPEEQEAAPKGIGILSAVEGGPAAKAGVKEGDRILKIDGTELKVSDDLRTIVRKHKKGDKLTLTMTRDGKEMELKVELEEMPANAAINNGIFVQPGMSEFVQFDRATPQHRTNVVTLKYDRVQLRDSNVLRGSVTEMTKDQVKMRFEEGDDVELDPEQVVTLAFAGDKSRQKNILSAVTLDDGSVLPAELVTLKEGKFVVKFPGGDQAEIPRDKVMALNLNGSGKGIVLNGHRNTGMWQISEQAQGWSWQDGLLTTEGANGQLVGMLPELPDACVVLLEYKTAGAETPRVRMDLGRSFNSMSPGSLVIDANEGGVNCSQYDGRSYVNLAGSSAPLLGEEVKPVPAEREVNKVVVFLHRTKGKMVVSLNDGLPREFKISKVRPTDLGKLGREFGIVPIVQRRARTQITQFSILPWDGGEPNWGQISIKQNQVHFADGKIRSLALVGLTDKEATFEGGETVPRDTVAFAVLAPDKVVKNEGRAIARVELASGNSLAASEVLLKDSKIRVRLTSGPEVSFPTEVVRTLLFDRPAFKADEAPASDILTFASGRQWSGKLVTPLQEGKLSWAMPAARKPIAVDQIKVAGVRINRVEDTSSAAPTDQVVRLTNGDWICGTVTLVNEQEMHFKTAFAESLVIPNQAIASFYPHPSTAMLVTDGAQWDFDYSAIGFRDLSLCRSHDAKHTFVRMQNNGVAGMLVLPVAKVGGAFTVGFTLETGYTYCDLSFAEEGKQPLFRVHCYGSQLIVQPRVDYNNAGGKNGLRVNRAGFGRQAVFSLGDEARTAPMTLGFVVDESTRSLQVFADGKRVGESKLGKDEEWGQVSRLELRPINVNIGGQTLGGFWTAPWDHRQSAFSPQSPGKVAVALVNGDEVEGAFRGIKSDELSVEADFGEIPLPLSRVSVVNFRALGGEPNCPHKIYLYPRGSVAVNSVKFAGDHVVCSTDKLGEISVPFSQIRELVLKKKLDAK